MRSFSTASQAVRGPLSVFLEPLFQCSRLRALGLDSTETTNFSRLAGKFRDKLRAQEEERCVIQDSGQYIFSGT